MDDNVRVMVRCRPLSSKEIEQKCQICVFVNQSIGSIRITRPESSKLTGSNEAKFQFDHTYGFDSKQQVIYEESCRLIVDGVLNGFNGTIFAYGQTGTGKTHTMEGVDGDPGVTPRAFEHIFAAIKKEDDSKKFLVAASYLEIYQEKLKDLLVKGKEGQLNIHESPENGIHVPDLTTVICENPQSIVKVMTQGKKRRTTASTNMNETSSRSHGIFMIRIECQDMINTDADGNTIVRVGKLNLVDLAGSERQEKTGAQGQQLSEANCINKSLMNLGDVIKKLTRKNPQHIPYRNSKLTRLLQDSLGGNAKTVMIANVGPADYNFDETFSTLRYANRAKQIKNKPIVNCTQDAMVLRLQEEIEQLKAQLAKQQQGGCPQSSIISSVGGERVIYHENTEAIKHLQEEMEKKVKEKDDALESEKGRLEEERKKIEDDLNRRKEELEKERLEREKTAKRLKQMEEKVIKGGSHLQKMEAKHKKELAEYERRKQEELRLKEAELEEERKKREQVIEEEKRKKDQEMEELMFEQKKRERELSIQLQKREQIEKDMKKKHASLEEEAISKKKMLDDLMKMYNEAVAANKKLNEENQQIKIENKKVTHEQQKIQHDLEELKEEDNRKERTLAGLQDEMEEMQNEFELEKEQLVDTILGLEMEMKQDKMIIDYFIPPSEVEKIRKQTIWVEDGEVWDIIGSETAGNVVRGLLMPQYNQVIGTNGIIDEIKGVFQDIPDSYGSSITPPSSQDQRKRLVQGINNQQRIRPQSSNNNPGYGLGMSVNENQPVAPPIHQRRNNIGEGNSGRIGDNSIIQPSLDMPERATRDLDLDEIEQKSRISRMVSETLNAGEEEIMVEPVDNLPDIQYTQNIQQISIVYWNIVRPEMGRI